MNNNRYIMAEGFSEQQLDQLDSRIRKVFNEGIEVLVIPQFEEMREILDDHTIRLTRIEQKQDAQEKLVDYHDREIERILKHEKLEPLPLER